MTFNRFQFSWLRGLLFVAAALSGCRKQARQAPLQGRVFVRGRKFSYAAAHVGAGGRLLGRDTVAITCLGKWQYDTTQLKLAYSYGAASAPSSFSGVMDYDTVLWMHPPRDWKYRILELSPFPYIRLPARQGQRWQWPLNVGSQWGDTHWATWQGNLRVTSSYTVTGQQQLATPLGRLPCWVVQAEATCLKGTSALTSFYNPRYGFVRLAYRNLNNHRVTLNLVAVTTVETPQPNEFLPKAFQKLGPAGQP